MARTGSPNMNEHPEETNAAGQRELVNEFSGAPWLSDLAAAPTPDVRSCLGQIGQRTLIYNGERDLEEFKQGAAILVAELVNVERLVIRVPVGFRLWGESGSRDSCGRKRSSRREYGTPKRAPWRGTPTRTLAGY